MPATSRFAHDVYFALIEDSPQKRQELVRSCYELLGSIAEVDELVAGIRLEAMARDVNDKTFAVALHARFADRAAHDAYQKAPAHAAFIEANEANWAEVRVFDSTIDAHAR